MAFKIGAKPSAVSNNGLFYTIPLAEPTKVKVLVDLAHLVTGEFCKTYHNKKELIWSYTESDKDPCYALNVKPQFSVLIPSIVKIGDEKVYKIIRGPATLHKLLYDAGKSAGTLLGTIVEITTTEKKQFREYGLKLIGKGSVPKEYEDQDKLINELETQIKAGTPEEVQEWLNEKMGKSKGIIEEDF